MVVGPAPAEAEATVPKDLIEIIDEVPQAMAPTRYYGPSGDVGAATKIQARQRGNAARKRLFAENPPDVPKRRRGMPATRAVLREMEAFRPPVVVARRPFPTNDSTRRENERRATEHAATSLKRRCFRAWRTRPHRKKKTKRTFTFERPLHLWLPFNALPVPTVLHEHETLELRRLVGDGRLLLHAHSDRGAPVVVDAVLFDTASRLAPRDRDNAAPLSRSFGFVAGLTVSFSAEPTSPVAWDRLGFEVSETPGDGVVAEFVVVATFSEADRVDLLPGIPEKPPGFDEHPLRRLFARQPDHHNPDALPHMSYNSPLPAVSKLRPQPQTAPTSARRGRNDDHQVVAAASMQPRRKKKSPVADSLSRTSPLDSTAGRAASLTPLRREPSPRREPSLRRPPKNPPHRLKIPPPQQHTPRRDATLATPPPPISTTRHRGRGSQDDGDGASVASSYFHHHRPPVGPLAV